MRTEKLRAFVPFLVIDGVQVFAILMLLQVDWIVNHTLYHYNLSFSLDWAVPYWTTLRTILSLPGLVITAVTVIGYGSYKKARKESEKVIFICKSCWDAWTELDTSVRVKKNLPKFKILKVCPSCNNKLLKE